MSMPIWFRTISSVLIALTFVGASEAYSPVKKHDLTIAFDNLRDYPDYDFYLKYGHRENGGYRTLHLKFIGPEPIRLTLREKEISEVTEFYLFAVPRDKQVSAPPGKGHTDEWIRNVPEGTFQVGPLLTRDGLTFPQRRLRIRFAVTIDNGKLNAEHINWHTLETITAEIIGYLPLALVVAVFVGLVLRAWQNNRRTRWSRQNDGNATH